MKQALIDGYWLEVIALQESMLADRLESLHAVLVRPIGGFSVNGVKGDLAKSTGVKMDVELASRIDTWWAARCLALHEMVKHLDGHDATWAERMAHAEATAKSGEKLVRDVDKWVRRSYPK